MAKYNLGFYDGKNSEKIDLSNIVELNKLSDIDDFTSQFSNKEELLNYLLEKELISIEDFNRKLRIIYKSKDEIKFKGIVYNDAKKYLKLDTVSLRYKFQILFSNPNFISELIDFYRHSKYVSINELEGCKEIFDNISYNERKEIIDTIYEDALFIMGNFNYSGFRKLALFIYKFELNEKLKKIKLATAKEEKTKEKFILSSDGEPDFPPNSEEERQYNEYMKYQDRNWDKNKDYFDKFYPKKKI